MPKGISDHLKNVKLYINLVRYSYEIIECKLVLKVLLFHILSAWVKHQIVDMNIQGLS